MYTFPVGVTCLCARVCECAHVDFVITKCVLPSVPSVADTSSPLVPSGCGLIKDGT